MSIQVMIVDDDFGARTVVGLMLERSGFQVVKVEGGEAALAFLESATPTIIVLDIMMPGMDGIELCKRIRARQQTAQTPIIFVSAYINPELTEQCKKAGGNTYLRKPVVTGELVGKVREYVKVEGRP